MRTKANCLIINPINPITTTDIGIITRLNVLNMSAISFLKLKVIHFLPFFNILKIQKCFDGNGFSRKVVLAWKVIHLNENETLSIKNNSFLSFRGFFIISWMFSCDFMENLCSEVNKGSTAIFFIIYFKPLFSLSMIMKFTCR